MKRSLLPHMKDLQFISLISAGIMLFLMNLFIINLPVTQSQQSSNTVIQTHPWFQSLRVSISTPPIFIDGTDPAHNWDECPWVNGSGTFGDPYVLQDLIIDGGGSGSCIKISNTREYFRIENCTLKHSESGMIVWNSTNGIIHNNTCTLTYIGIKTYFSNNITIIGNNCSGNSNGFWVYGSTNNTLAGNNCTENTIGIVLYIDANNNTLIGNNCSGNSQHGIYLHGAHKNVVIGNNCTGNLDAGISLYIAYNCTISGNNCSENTYGFFIRFAHESKFYENNCTRNSEFGFYILFSNLMEIFRNTAKNNGISPFEEEKCDFNDIHHNWFWDVPIVSFSPIICWAETGVEFVDLTLGDAPLSYQWNFGDGTSNATVKDPTHYFALPGTYTVILMVTDFVGNVAVNASTVIVQVNCRPSARFTTNISVLFTGQWIAFTDDTTSGDTPFSYQWNFGDGSGNVTIPNPTHQYAAVGIFTVTLTIMDASGDISVYQIIIVVLDWTWLLIIFIICASIPGIAIVYRKWGPILTRYFRYSMLKKAWLSGIARLKRIIKNRALSRRQKVIEVSFDASDFAPPPRRILCPNCWQPTNGLICPRCGKVIFFR